MSYSCPRCKRVQHFVCNNNECICQKNLRKGQRPQIYNETSDDLSCSYCGFTESFDYWEDREVNDLKKRGLWPNQKKEAK